MTYFTLNYTETASLRPVLPPGREEAGGSDAVALSKAHIRRKSSPKVIFRAGSSFYSVIRPGLSNQKGGGIRSNIQGFLKLQGGDYYTRSPGSVEMPSFHVL